MKIYIPDASFSTTTIYITEHIQIDGKYGDDDDSNKLISLTDQTITSTEDINKLIFNTKISTTDSIELDTVKIETYFDKEKHVEDSFDNQIQQEVNSSIEEVKHMEERFDDPIQQEIVDSPVEQEKDMEERFDDPIQQEIVDSPVAEEKDIEDTFYGQNQQLVGFDHQNSFLFFNWGINYLLLDLIIKSFLNSFSCSTGESTISCWI